MVWLIYYSHVIKKIEKDIVLNRVVYKLWFNETGKFKKKNFQAVQNYINLKIHFEYASYPS